MTNPCLSLTLDGEKHVYCQLSLGKLTLPPDMSLSKVQGRQPARSSQGHRACGELSPDGRAAACRRLRQDPPALPGAVRRVFAALARERREEFVVAFWAPVVVARWRFYPHIEFAIMVLGSFVLRTSRHHRPCCGVVFANADVCRAVLHMALLAPPLVGLFHSFLSLICFTLFFPLSMCPFPCPPSSSFSLSLTCVGGIFLSSFCCLAPLSARKYMGARVALRCIALHCIALHCFVLHSNVRWTACATRRCTAFFSRTSRSQAPPSPGQSRLAPQSSCVPPRF